MFEDKVDVLLLELKIFSWESFSFFLSFFFHHRQFKTIDLSSVFASNNHIHINSIDVTILQK